MNHRKLKESLHARKKDWSFLDQIEVPYAGYAIRSHVVQRKLSVEGVEQSAYIKVYSNCAHPAERILRPSRSRCEAYNLCFMEQLGLKTPKVLAWGERRNKWGKKIQDFLITQSIPEAVTLDEYIRSDARTTPTRLKIARELGSSLRRLHEQNFFHKDIHFRNLLVAPTSEGSTLFFIDCPRGRFHHSQISREHWRLKDLAILDKYASVLCSHRERCTFLEAYLELKLSERTFLKEANRIRAFRKKRYDNRKGRQAVKL